MGCHVLIEWRLLVLITGPEVDPVVRSSGTRALPADAQSLPGDWRTKQRPGMIYSRPFENWGLSPGPELRRLEIDTPMDSFPVAVT